MHDFNLLIAQGYRLISRKYGLIARIDRPDWKEAMAEQHPSGMRWVEGLGDHANDYYRRNHSKDTKTLGMSFGRNIPTSTNDPVGYIEELP